MAGKRTNKSRRTAIEQYIASQYSVEPDYPWDGYEYAVFRHAGNRKWFALTMRVRRDKLDIAEANKDNGGDDGGFVDVINLKIDDPVLHDMIVHEKGIIPSYHMNKRHWITVLLDGTVADSQVEELIDISYMATSPKRRKTKDRAPREWIVPANPKYYDAVHAFDEADEIDWKQGAGIRTGDTVYLYVASPVSAILFKCRVTETDIPYDYEDRNLRISSLMKIRLLRRYDSSEYTWVVLRDEFGINAIRGPRGIPNSLSERLNGG